MAAAPRPRTEATDRAHLGGMAACPTEARGRGGRRRPGDSRADAVFQQTTSVRSQTPWKHMWLQLLVHTCCDTGQSAVVLCVRGLRRARRL